MLIIRKKTSIGEFFSQYFFLLCGIHCTKFECILKATLMPTNRTPRVRGEAKLNRTLGLLRHCLASLGNPKKKKCSLLFGFARDQFFLKMERIFFFLGFWPPSLQAGGGTMRTKFWQNYFLGKGFAKTSTDLFLNLDVANGKGGVWGGILRLLRFLFLGNSGGQVIQKPKPCPNFQPFSINQTSWKQDKH